MSVKNKYQAVLELGEALGVQDGSVTEENGVLKIKGQTKTQYEKNILWDKIKEIGGDKPADIMASTMDRAITRTFALAAPATSRRSTRVGSP